MIFFPLRDKLFIEESGTLRNYPNKITRQLIIKRGVRKSQPHPLLTDLATLPPLPSLTLPYPPSLFLTLPHSPLVSLTLPHRPLLSLTLPYPPSPSLTLNHPPSLSLTLPHSPLTLLYSPCHNYSPFQ